MRFLSLIFIILLDPISAWATGWNDYELPLQGGYSIFRANSLEVTLLRDRRTIVSHFDFPEIGPITDYFQDGDTIFLRTAGAKDRKLFDGDTFKDVDLTKTFYFVVTGSDPTVYGPLNEQHFLAHELVRYKLPINWQIPRNPNFWTPLFGASLFIIIAIPMLYIKFWYVTLPVTSLLVWCAVLYWKRSRTI